MGDKSPKQKQRATDQKDAAKKQVQSTKDKRQQDFSAAPKATPKR